MELPRSSRRSSGVPEFQEFRSPEAGASEFQIKHGDLASRSYGKCRDPLLAPRTFWLCTPSNRREVILVLLELLVSTTLAPDTTLRPARCGSSFYYLAPGEVPAAKLHPSAPK